MVYDSRHGITSLNLVTHLILSHTYFTQQQQNLNMTHYAYENDGDYDDNSHNHHRSHKHNESYSDFVVVVV